MSIRPASALALSAAFGCTFEVGPASDTASTTDPGNTSTSDPTATTGDLPTTTTTTTTEPTTTATDTEGAPRWCHGFDPALSGLTLANEAGTTIIDGTPLIVVCGGQGVLMIPIYPHLGGFTPLATTVSFDVILDVDDFNLGPTGHFAELIGQNHTVDCSDESPYYSFTYDFLPIFPPDGLPDINAIHAKKGHLHLTLHAPDGDISFDADVILEANINACGFPGYDTDPDYDTDTDTDTSTG